MARSRPEDIEYINRLKFGSRFNYVPEHHSAEDVESENYFHNISTRYLNVGDEIQVCIKHEDKSWSKCWFEVVSITPEDTRIDRIGTWRDLNKPQKAPAPAKPAKVREAA
jgi:hypothetical protein